MLMELNRRLSRLPPIRPSGVSAARVWLLALLLLAAPSHALYQNIVTAYKLPSGATVKVDGKPETLWRAIGATQPATANFFDYGKIVLLASDKIRNDDPKKYYQAPSKGGVSLMAAYDDANLYFFFLVKENSTFDPRSACGATDFWKANAAEVYVDYNSWSETLYQSYFSLDAGGFSYGTSKKSFQLDKPAYPAETRKYFRDRTKNDRFEIRALPSGLDAVAARQSDDSMTVGVEMKIPFPAGYSSAFAPGASLFISWGYNHYPDTAASDCSGNPIAYRWAKHYKTYTAASSPKPPGWRDGDSTHYDPTRSWDGWGRFYLSPTAVDTTHCRPPQDKWDVAYWESNGCGNNAVSRAWRPQAVPGFRSETFPGRDLRGRESTPRGGQILFRTK